MDSSSGYYDSNTRTIYPVSTSTWDQQSGSTWANWTTWAATVSDEIIWVTDPIFLGLNPSNINLKITCVSTGTVSYRVYTSATGVFGGEEVETIIPAGSQNIPSFRASYIQVVVYSNRTTVPLNIREITIETRAPRANDVFLNDVDSSQLQGSVTERMIPVSGDTGTIVDIKITPHEVTAYNLDVYVANTPTSTYVVPKIINKSSSSPSFALVGMDNHPRDAVVDIMLKTLNRCRMVGNNIVSN